MMHGLSGQAAFERRLKEFERLLIERLVPIRLIAEIRGEHQEGMPRIAHHRFRHQAEIANARAIGGKRRLKGYLQSRGRGIELRGAANAADARCYDERIFGIAPDQNLLIAAIHRTDTPGVCDRVIVNLYLDLEVAFDPIHIHLYDLLRHDNERAHSMTDLLYSKRWAPSAEPSAKPARARPPDGTMVC